MTPRRLKWVILLMAVALGVMVIVFSRSREPSFQGRTLSEWLTMLTAHLAAQTRNTNSASGQFDEQASVIAIRSMGTDALPLLCFDPSNSPVHTTIMTSASKIPATGKPRGVRIWLVNQGSWGRRFSAAVSFAALGGKAEAAIPELTRSMNQAGDVDTRFRAALALAGIGTPQALTNLMANARSSNATTRQIIYESLHFILPHRANDDVIAPFLVTALRDSPEGLKPEIIETMGHLNPTNPANVDILVEALSAEIQTRTFKDLDAAIREALRNPSFLRSPSWSEGAAAAALAIGHFGEQARPAVPVLLSAATNLDENLRINALKSLRQIEPAAITNLPAW
jgi:HEAT repeat protein